MQAYFQERGPIPEERIVSQKDDLRNTALAMSNDSIIALRFSPPIGKLVNELPSSNV